MSYISSYTAASFRPEVEIAGRITRVLAEQTAAVDPTASVNARAS
jgi:mRNA interferase MazF